MFCSRIGVSLDGTAVGELESRASLVDGEAIKVERAEVLSVSSSEMTGGFSETDDSERVRYLEEYVLEQADYFFKKTARNFSLTCKARESRFDAKYPNARIGVDGSAYCASVKACTNRSIAGR